MRTNPLIAGFYPDPSVVKVGADYYLVNSTFEYLPGIPVFHSRDLVDWKQIGHVVSREGQLASHSVPTLGGAWAPTIRHRDGVFYVVVTDAMGRGMLVFTASDPAGPWSDGIVIDGVHGIDPDLAWDSDGRAYVTYSGLDVTSGNPPGEHAGILQVTVDLSTGAVLSSPVSLWSGTGLKFPEAPHLYMRGEYWYLVIAEGGTERGHGISVARGLHPAGPFESGPGNPILSARSTARPIQNTGHGDLVETPDGGWAIVMLGMRPTGMTQAFSAMGRETFITDARWTDDGWLEADPVLLNPRPGEFVFSDSFEGSSLGLEWIGVRRYPSSFASSSALPGHVVLTGDGSTLDDLRPAFLGYRQQHPVASASVVVDPGASGVGGLAVRYDELHHYEVEVSGGVVTARAAVAGIRQEWSVDVPSDSPVTLGLDFVASTGEGFLPNLTSDLVVLSATTTDGSRHELARVDGRYLSQETAASFTGRVIGLYATRGEVLFTAFRYTGREGVALVE
ncbi:glycoside hydrolase family 43 protein [Agreia pratensis]|uniref:Beta-xylosidase n=1 Tax=Agreia pratensis TaxID=150121 RepID=A0A1X7IUV5_9MICO|nr:glycoside hydrolase family 43 protein [Agreia pratensis]SMG18995.1 Beta-xylosidase [Agreia pratensis]